MDKNVRENWRTELLLIKELPAADESHWVSPCCLGTRFTQRWGTTPFCIWGHIQDDVKARWIIQDLMKSNKRKSAGSARKGKKNLTITSLPKREDFKLVGIAQMARSNKTTHYTKHRPKHKKPQQISFVINEEWSLFKPENTQYDHISLKSYQKWGEKFIWVNQKLNPSPRNHWFGCERIPGSMRAERSQEEAILHLVTWTDTHFECFLESICEQLTGCAEGRAGFIFFRWPLYKLNRHTLTQICFWSVYNTLCGLEQQGLCDGSCLYIQCVHWVVLIFPQLPSLWNEIKSYSRTSYKFLLLEYVVGYKSCQLCTGSNVGWYIYQFVNI